MDHTFLLFIFKTFSNLLKNNLKSLMVNNFLNYLNLRIPYFLFL